MCYFLCIIFTLTSVRVLSFLFCFWRFSFLCINDGFKYKKNVQRHSIFVRYKSANYNHVMDVWKQ